MRYLSGSINIAKVFPAPAFPPPTTISAGQERNFIWNHLSGREKFDFETDIDVIFFDPTVSYEETLQIEKRLREAYPLYSWEVKNQVYMHIHSSNTKPYTSSQDAMSRYPETCTLL